MPEHRDAVAPARVDRSLRGAAALVGVADAVSPTGELDRHGQALEAAVVRDALADAGLTLDDVDGVCHATSSMQLAEYLGIHPRFTDSTNTGGSSFEVHVEHAAAAIAAGLCEVVVGVYAATPRSDRHRPAAAFPRRSPADAMLEWELPYGLRQPMGAYALAASRHMHEFGTTAEQLAQIAVSTRAWATRNERARYQTPLTIDDVLDSPMESTPLHRLDCCLVTDGAGAFVLTSAERARTLAKPPVYVLGAGTCHDHLMISQMPDLTTTPGVVSGATAFAMAGCAPSDVDVLMGYDSFTITALLHLEDLGFCAKGEGGPFAEDGRLGPGGSLPMNTNGGGLSYTHPGMYGMFLIVEAVRQLRGECGARQVDGAEVAVAHGSGMVLSCMSTLVLGTEATR
ncbi:MAG TPA: acetyl-CoA acetyltransferase [Acidimicrobiales bacterium]|nr:acetyl-CoA acetyltransferase [Acidimicrobiales bacterium]